MLVARDTIDDEYGRRRAGLGHSEAVRLSGCARKAEAVHLWRK